jgi:hypothetical protein
MRYLKPQYALLALITSWITGWIPVTRRLPTHKHKGVTLGIICLVLHNGYFPAVAIFSPSDKIWYESTDGSQYRNVTEWVTHWKSTDIPRIIYHQGSIIYSNRKLMKEIDA